MTAGGNDTMRSFGESLEQRAERAARRLRNARLLWSASQVQQAMDRMAEAVTQRLSGRNPLLLVVMTGGMWPALELSRRLTFPHQLDYLHATRYRGRTEGGALQWRVHPRLPLAGRDVLVVDDILDEGLTLRAVIDSCRDAQAGSVLSAVLVDKRHDRRRAELSADFIGVPVDDVYVFGCGMDVEEYWRGLPAIYALNDEPR